MSTAITLLLLSLCIFAAALYEGSETGLYSLSRLRVEAEAREGRTSARLIRRLLRDDLGLLATLLIGANLALESATYLAGHLASNFGVPPAWRELVSTAILTPVVFLFAELLPKDLFRRRPHTLVGYTAPFIGASKSLLLPLTIPVRVISSMAERMLGLEVHELARVHGREAVLELLQESEVALQPQVESMARNVLELRGVPVERVMVPWRKVEHLEASLDPGAVYQRLARTTFSRLPVVQAGGPQSSQGTVVGYVHQLEVLGSGPDTPLAGLLRPMISVEPTMPLDRALARLRESGQRAAVVGSLTRPLGLVTLKDLVEEISGELARW